ncbi:MAG: CarD family transcriptional regulator [Clostridiales bacterium]|nr:CarD family transcriptional regulator [Clostridiales bacterium]
MFAVGDKIVYPTYGAGVIVDLVERDYNGSMEVYYDLRIPVGNLKLLINARNAETLGLRRIYDKDEMCRIIEDVSLQPISMPENWNVRCKNNMDKIKSGRLTEVTIVFRNLLFREKQRGLSSMEKKMMTTAKQIIVSEIILSHEVEKCKAEDLLTGMLSEVAR